MILASTGTMLQLHEGTAAKHHNKAAITHSTSFQPFHLQKMCARVPLSPNCCISFVTAAASQTPYFLRISPLVNPRISA